MLARALVLAVVAAIIAGCATRRSPAPVFDARAPKAITPAASAAARPAADLYTVRRGDTLYSIALEHGADYRELAQWNNLDDPTRLRAGQQLRVTPPETQSAPSVQVGAVRAPSRLESRPLESRPSSPAPAAPQKDLVKLEPAPAVAQFGGFIWPVKGKVLAEFAEPRRKGIDIDGRPGDPIVAAAPGRVTYIGSGIPGMGRLVVLKHDNGFITVYAHNEKILVKEQQAVARGQQIAVLGSTDAERPKLHFQIRKGASAVDPLLYLPR